MSRSAGWRTWTGALLGLLALGWACWPGSPASSGQWRVLATTSGAQVASVPKSVPAPTPPPGSRPAVAPPSADHRLDRPPSLSAAQIEAILAEYHSPAGGLGAVFYDQ